MLHNILPCLENNISAHLFILINQSIIWILYEHDSKLYWISFYYFNLTNSSKFQIIKRTVELYWLENVHIRFQVFYLYIVKENEVFKK